MKSTRITIETGQEMNIIGAETTGSSIIHQMEEIKWSFIKWGEIEIGISTILVLMFAQMVQMVVKHVMPGKLRMAGIVVIDMPGIINAQID